MFSMKILHWLILAGCCAGLSVSAQDVADIVFNQQGKAPVQREFLEHNTRLRKGMHFTSELLDEDVKRLYQTGVFSDIQASSVKQADGNMVLKYTMKLKPQVRKIIISGNEKLKESALLEKVVLAENAPLNDRNLRETVSELRKLYHGDGYNDVQINWKIEDVEDGVVDVRITIRENLKVRVHSVTVEPLPEDVSEDELKSVMANRYSWYGSIPLIGSHLNAGLLDRGELSADQARMRDVFLKHGYLDIQIKSLKIEPLADDPEYADIRIQVDAGKPYKVTKVSVTGADADEAAELQKMVTVVPESIFSLEQENATVKALTDYYESLGHIDVSVRAVRLADYAGHTVEIKFEVVPGRRYHVRQVHVVNNVYTKDKVIRRELAVQPGDPVDRSRIEVSRSRLMAMGYFSKVEALTANADDVNEKDVEFRVEEKDERFNFKVGAGFSDINSLVGMAEISSNNFDLFSPENWFYGGGQRFRVQGLFGIERSSVNIDFTEPWLFDLPLRLDVAGYWNYLDYDNWTEERFGARVGLTRKIFDDFTSISGAYKIEQVRVFDMAKKLGGEWQDQEGREWLGQFSLSLNRDTRDDLMNPTSGYNVNLLGAIAPKIFGSSNNLYRLEFKGSNYFSFWDKAIVVMAGLRAGVVSDFERDKPVPLYERYFLGGGDTLRGFPFREAGPEDRNGNVYGGSTMLLGTLEISHPIWSFIRGAVFVDAGNTWENPFSFGPGGINVGAGYGLRLQLPMINAPIKLDLAYPIVNNQDSLSSKFRFHFNMGFTW